MDACQPSPGLPAGAASQRRDEVGAVSEPDAMSRRDIAAEMERARVTFDRLLADASPDDLRRPSDGTKWTNEQLLFHMLFGFLIVRALLVLVRMFGRLPDGMSRGFASVLNAANRPFHVVNYWGSRVGARVFGAARMGHKLDEVIDVLQRRLSAETEQGLARRMHFPTHWDPFFADTMTLAHVYHYASQHFDYHRGQLTLGPGSSLTPFG